MVCPSSVLEGHIWSPDLPDLASHFESLCLGRQSWLTWLPAGRHEFPSGLVVLEGLQLPQDFRHVTAYRWG